MSQNTPVVKWLLGLHIAVFFAQSLLDIDLIGLLGLRCILSTYFKPYQFFTHLFIHASFSHLFSNIFSLFTFGPTLEHTLDSKKFITFYLITGLGAAALYAGIQYAEVKELATLCHTYLAQPDPESFVVYLNRFPHTTYTTLHPFISSFFDNPNDLAYITESKAIVHQLYTAKADMPTVGASGSIFGIFMAFAMLFPNTELFLFFVPIPIKTKYVIAIYSVYELYVGIKGNPADHVAHFVHLGGIVFAYFFIIWWKRRRYNW